MMKHYTLNDISIKCKQGDIIFYERCKTIIDECTKCFHRYAIQTHFVTPGESLMDYLKKYAVPLYLAGDILVIGEKITSLCANHVVHERSVKVGFWANLIAPFAGSSKSGRGAREPRKLQLTIDIVGLPRVLFAAVCAGFAKLLGIKGTFYKMVGHNIHRMDGFCSEGDNCPAFEYYNHIAVLATQDAGSICKEIESKLGMACVVADVNDLTMELIGRSPSVSLSDKQLALALRDNPAGQDNERTPLILLREIELQTMPETANNA